MRSKEDHRARRVEPIPARKDQVVGRRFIRVIEDELQALHEHCDHPNRTLFYDHIVVAHMLAFFNPAMKSLRIIEDVFEIPVIRRRFDLPHIRKSTLADAQRLFDRELILPLIESAKKRLRSALHDTRLDALTQKLLAVDGTFFAVAPRIACESQSGMTLQIYIAILGTILIAVATGAKPSCYDYNLMSLAASGMAPIEEVLVVAAKRRAERARAAASVRARASKKALR